MNIVRKTNDIIAAVMALQHTAIIGANLYSLTNVRFVRLIIILILGDLKMEYSDTRAMFFGHLKNKKKKKNSHTKYKQVSQHLLSFLYILPKSVHLWSQQAIYFYTVQLQFQAIKCTYAPYLSQKADMKFLQKYNSS